MKFRNFVLLFFVYLFLYTDLNAGVFSGDSPSILPGVEKPVLRDTVKVEMDKVLPICIDQSVLLTCSDIYDPRDILEYEWINNTTGKVIGTGRSVRVTPTATTTYTLQFKYIKRDQELIVNGDFERGNMNFSTGYQLAAYNGNRTLYPEGLYIVGDNPRTYHTNFIVAGDHTSATGQMMIVNGNTKLNIKVWGQTVNGIKDQQYAFSAWGMGISDGATARLQFSINNKVLQLTNSDNYELPKGRWVQFFKIWDPERATKADIALVDQTTATGGNDFVVDDISFAPVVLGVGEVEVKVLPKISLASLSDKEVCEGGDLEIKPVVSGSEITTYQWSKGGLNLGNGNYLKVVNADKTRDDGRYTIVVKGICGDASQEFNVNVRDSIKITPLADVLVCRDTKVELSSGVVAGYDLQYKWSCPPGVNSDKWLGKYNDIYWKNAVSLNDVGVYTCIVSNMCGLRTNTVKLSVDKELQILESPRSVTVCPGEPVKFEGKVNMTGVKITWTCPDGRIIEQDILSIPSAQVSDQGTYIYRVENGCGSIEKSVQLKLRESVENVILSEIPAVCEHERVVIKSNVDKGEGLVYLWQGPAGFVSGLDSAVITNVTELREGMYTLTVTDICHKQVIAGKRIDLIKEFEDLVFSGDTSVCRGEKVKLEGKSGTAGLKYEWTYPGGKQVIGSRLNLVNLGNGDPAGDYVCKVTGKCQPKIDTVTISLHEPLQVKKTTDTFHDCPGTNVILRAEASGAGLDYTWRKDGNILNRGSKTLALNNLSAEKEGIYLCELNSNCKDTVLKYDVVLREKTRIIDRTPDQYVSLREGVKMFVNAEGENNRYEWKVNGVAIGGNSNKLFINKPQPDVTGVFYYTCHVKGDCGEDQATIRITVGNYNVIARDTTVKLCEGGNYSFRAGGIPSGCTDESKLTYKWTFGGKNVSNVSVLTLSNLSASMTGQYTCNITGACGSMVIYMNVVMINTPKIIFARDTIQECEGTDIKLIANVNSNDFLTYEWRKNDVVQSGTTSTFLLRKATPADQGVYTCRVSGQFCGEDSKSVRVGVWKSLHTEDLPVETLACRGDQVVFSVKADGDSVKYAWQGPNALGWQGVKTPVYRNLSVTREADAGLYQCVVSSVCGTKILGTTLDVEKDLVILADTPDDTVCSGSSRDLYVRTNLDDVTYRWILPNGSTIGLDILRLTGINQTDAGIYKYNVQGRCMKETGEISLSIYPEMGMLNVRPDTSVCKNSAVRLYASVDGNKLKYRWMGPKYFVAYEPEAIVSIADSSNAGLYELVVTDVCNREQKGKVRITLLEQLKNLLVTKDTTICPGEDLRLEVSGGSPGLFYEWRFNGNVVGQDPVLVLSHVQDNAAGEYECLITGTCGSTGKRVNVSLRKPLTIDTEDALVRVCPDDPAVFSISADGENLKYIWSKSGKEVGNRADIFKIENVTPSDTGFYKCKVVSACGTADVVYHLEMKKKTAIKSHTPDRFLPERDTAMLFVRAEGEENQYEWSKDGVLLDENDDDILIIPDVGFVDTLHFVCAVKGECGVDTAWIDVKVGEYKTLKTLTSPDTLCEGSSYTYVANIVPDDCYGDENFSYVWMFKGVDLNNNNSLLTLRDISPVDSGTYTCRIYASCGIIERSWKIHVVSIPKILSMTEDSFVVEGANHDIEVEATGDNLVYSWMKDGSPLRNKRENLKFYPVAYEDRGMYKVKAENYCTAVYGTSKLDVWRKTTVISPELRNVDICPGADTILYVEALGAPGLVYRWFREGQALDIPCVGELVLKNVTLADAGLYTCVVSGKGGDDSCKIDLRLKVLPQISIKGSFAVCADADHLTQVYRGESNEEYMEYHWDVLEGNLEGGKNMVSAKVAWNGIGDHGIISLSGRSLNSGCVARIDSTVIFKRLPEINFDLPAEVGFCLDSLKLNQAYPSGGYYLVNDRVASSLQLWDKDNAYQVKYYYTDPDNGCISNISKTVSSAIEPLVALEKERLVTGSCKPAVIKVERSTDGLITWSGGDALDVSDPHSVVYTPRPSDPSDMYFEVKLTDKYDCAASDFTSVNVVALPVAKMMKDTLIGVCNEFSLTAGYNTPYFAGMEWFPQDRVKSMDDRNAVVVKKDVGKNDFWIVVTDEFGCQGRDSMVLNVYPAPDMNDATFCEADPLDVDCSSYYNFFWKDGFDGVVRKLDKSGDYVLHTVDRFGCGGDVFYTVHPTPFVQLRDTLLFEGQTVEFSVHPDEHYGPYEIRWHDKSRDYSFTTGEAGWYSVRVMDRIGCTASDSAFVEVKKRYIAAPNAFLPESSGENSKFYLKEVNFVSRFEMFIYNRWGEVVYRTNEIGYKGGWDGTYKGTACLPGAYLWVAYVDGNEIGKGTFMLVK